jgi:hypothetical protein
VEQSAPQSPKIVLALQAEPINFLHLELMPHELNVVLFDEEMDAAEMASGFPSESSNP